MSKEELNTQQVSFYIKESQKINEKSKISFLGFLSMLYFLAVFLAIFLSLFFSIMVLENQVTEYSPLVVEYTVCIVCSTYISIFLKRTWELFAGNNGLIATSKTLALTNVLILCFMTFANWMGFLNPYSVIYFVVIFASNFLTIAIKIILIVIWRKKIKMVYKNFLVLAIINVIAPVFIASCFFLNLTNANSVTKNAFSASEIIIFVVTFLLYGALLFTDIFVIRKINKKIFFGSTNAHFEHFLTYFFLAPLIIILTGGLLYFRSSSSVGNFHLPLAQLVIVIFVSIIMIAAAVAIFIFLNKSKISILAVDVIYTCFALLILASFAILYKIDPGSQSTGLAAIIIAISNIVSILILSPISKLNVNNIPFFKKIVVFWLQFVAVLLYFILNIVKASETIGQVFMPTELIEILISALIFSVYFCYLIFNSTQLGVRIKDFRKKY